MNTFRMQCVNYLLVRGWEQDVDGHEWCHDYHYGAESAQPVYRETLGAALDTQLEWDDEGPH